MNTQELLQLITRLPSLASSCLGVYPSDMLPEVTTYPSCFIANIQDHTKPGSHWVSVYIDEKRQSTYFDSFAEPPIQGFYSYLKRHAQSMSYNTVRVQSLMSETCGLHCIFFLKLKSLKWSMKYILTRFYTGDPMINDCKVVQEYYKLL